MAAAHLFSARQHELLSRLCGPEGVAVEEHTFWDELLPFSGHPLSRLPPAEAEVQLGQHAAALATNGALTKGFHTLLHRMGQLVARARGNTNNTAAVNAVYLVRVLSKCVVEAAGAAGLTAFLSAEHPVVGAFPSSPHPFASTAPTPPSTAAHFHPSPTHDDPTVVLRTTAELLLRAVSGELQVAPATYLLKLEAANCLMVLMSSQLTISHTAPPPGSNPFTDVILERGSGALAPTVTQSLLQLLITYPPLPLSCSLYNPSAPATPEAAAAAKSASPSGSNGGRAGPATGTTATTQGRGLLRRMGSAASSMLAAPLKAATALLSSGPGSPLADAALRLLLLLTYTFPQPPSPSNPFRTALHGLQDARYSSEGSGPLSPSAGMASSSRRGPTAAVSYADLHSALGRRMAGSALGALLFYALLSGSKSFREYALVCSHPEAVLLPLLEQLYHATAPGSSAPAATIYVPLVTCLLLSQDAGFAGELHRAALPGGAPWYKERAVPAGGSLGSLLVLVLLRTAHFNLAHTRDPYLSMTALACLSNLAPHFSALSSHASQRLVTLFDMLRRRFSQLQRAAGEEGLGEEEAADRAAELAVQGDFLRTVLELISATLVHALPRNPELAYTLLHRQELFADFGAASPEFCAHIANINAVVAYFNGRVEAKRAAQGWDWSVDRVLEVIHSDLRTWRPDRLHRFPQLKFSYEEEAEPQHFFVPYVWRLVVADGAPPGPGGVPWHLTCVQLFAPSIPLQEAATATSAAGEAVDAGEAAGGALVGLSLGEGGAAGSKLRSPARPNRTASPDEAV